MSSPEADLLKVSPGASLEDIKKAYRREALVHHPDHSDHPEAARHFRRLTEAYRILSESALRREPPRPKTVPVDKRIEFVLLDLRSLLKRWPRDRWNASFDGLPAAVWAAGILGALDRAWPAGPPLAVPPTPEGLAAALDQWTREGVPLPPGLKPLQAAVSSAESRLKALQAPVRGRRRT